MNKETASPILVDNSEVTSEVTFIPDASDGEIEMTFTFDARSLGESSIVVFEYLYKNGIEITTHTDINDEDQTVIIKTPKIGTFAALKATGKQEAVVDDWVTIVDTISFTGLIPGKSYYLNGKLMDKSTGEVIISGGKEVTSFLEFVPYAPDGEVEMTFNFSVDDLEGQETVVFENLYRNNIEIATHADLNDSSQIVTLIKPPSLPKTGEISSFNLLHSSITIVTMLIALIVVLIVASIIILLYYLRYNSNTLIERDAHTIVDELISDSKDEE